MQTSQSKSPAFSWYPKDHLSSARVAEMSIDEEGFYRRMLDFAWLNEGLPADPQRIANIVGKGCTVEIVRSLVQMFERHPKDASKIVCARQEIERKKQRDNSQKRKEAGRLSGVSRREKRDIDREQKPNKNEHSDSSSLIPIPITISITEVEDLIDRVAADFPKDDRRLLEIGVLQTLIRRKDGEISEPIRSFKYFGPEVSRILEGAKDLKNETIDGILQARRESYFHLGTNRTQDVIQSPK